MPKVARRWLAVTGSAVVLTTALTACGGSSATSPSGEASSPVSAATGQPGDVAPAGAPSGSAAVGEVCAALTPAQVQAVLGYDASGQGGASGSDAFGLSYCTWGSPDKGALMALQVFTPGAVEDPLALLVSALPGEPLPVAGLADGKQYAAGIMPGGGGVGSSVTWTMDGRQYALGLVGTDLTAEQQRALAEAARQVTPVAG
jgi:hypothetical protein